jgi:hypothetical protein
MARAGLLLGRCNDPDIVTKLSRHGLEQPQAAGVHAVVVGQKYAHCSAMGEARKCRNREEIAPYSQQLGDFFTGSR